MDLKEFIKVVIADITEAVSESQHELKNNSIICPKNVNNNKLGYIMEVNDCLTVSNILFDIGVTTENHQTLSGQVNTKIGVSVASFGGEGNGSDTYSKGQMSRISFSIPLILPPFEEK